MEKQLADIFYVIVDTNNNTLYNGFLFASEDNAWNIITKQGGEEARNNFRVKGTDVIAVKLSSPY